MEARLVQHGDEIALILDRELLAQMHIDLDSKLSVQTHENEITITVEDEDRNALLEQIMDEMDEDYGPVFKRLAE